MDGHNLSFAYRKMDRIPVSFITGNDDGVKARQTLWLDLTECYLRYLRTYVHMHVCIYVFMYVCVYVHTCKNVKMHICLHDII